MFMFDGWWGVVLKNVDTDMAMKLLFEQRADLRTETVTLDHALLRIISQTVYAKMPIPPFDRSPFDGYAFRAEDTVGASYDHPTILKIVEELPAGTLPKHEITAGLAAKILTGAPIPKGANTTIKYEDTEFSDQEVRIFSPIKPNTNLVYAGADVKADDVLALQGAVVSAPMISSFANQGFVGVDVYKKPMITVISTGTELCEIGQPLKAASIYNSNVHTICAYLDSFGAMPINGGCVPDESVVIAEKIKSALSVSDMVITTGGASVGDYDWAVTAMKELDAQILFWKTSLRPGGATLAAVVDGKIVLGLSGNPAAAVIGLLRIGMPYIKKLCGRADCFFQEIYLKLCEPVSKDSPKQRILRGTLEIEDAIAYFKESGSQGSETISSFDQCDLLGEIPMGSPPLPAGAIIKAYRM